MISADLLQEIRLDVIDSYKNFDSKFAELVDANDRKNTSNILTNELNKLEKNVYSIGVVGVMKAGKSTFINAILGQELLPHRDLGMTFIPTKIMHDKALKDNVSYSFSQYHKFQKYIERIAEKKFLEKIAKILNSKSLDGQYIELLRQEKIIFQPKLSDKEQILQQLLFINDTARLSSLIVDSGLDKENLLDYIETDQDLPLISTYFYSLDTEIEVSSNICLIDTPGPDEASQNLVLGKILKKALSQSSAIYCVVNGKAVDNVADNDLRDQIKSFKAFIGEELRVIVNQKDQLQSVDAIKDKILQGDLFEGYKLDESKIFFVSAKYALFSQIFAAKMDYFIQNYSALRETPESWMSNFASCSASSLQTFIEDIDDEKSESDENGNDDKIWQKEFKRFLTKKCNRTFRDSGFDDLRKNSLLELYKQSSIGIVLSSINTMYAVIEKYVKTKVDGALNLKKKEVEEVNEFIVRLDDLLTKLNQANEKLSNHFDVLNSDVNNSPACYATIITGTKAVINMDNKLKQNSIQTIKKSYADAKSILDKHQSSKSSSKSDADNFRESFENQLRKQMDKLDIDLKELAKLLVDERIQELEEVIQENFDPIALKLNQLSEDIVNWKITIPSFEQFCYDFDYSAIKLDKKENPKGFWIFGRRIFRGKFGYETPTYKLDVGSFNQQITDFIKEYIESGMSQVRRIGIVYQKELETHQARLNAIVTKDLNSRKKTKEEQKIYFDNLESKKQEIQKLLSYLDNCKLNLGR